MAGLNRVYALRNTYNIASANMSLGGGIFSSSCDNENSLITEIISKLKSARIATTVSSGNNGYSANISFPACVSDAIAVGATSDFTGALLGSSFVTDQRVFYSNNSGQLDIYAPGSVIRSSVPGNGFEEFNGTSMAAPHVAGAYAIFKHAMPDQTVFVFESVIKNSGPVVSHSGVNRRRLDISDVLRKFGFERPPIIPVLQILLDD